MNGWNEKAAAVWSLGFQTLFSYPFGNSALPKPSLLEALVRDSVPWTLLPTFRRYIYLIFPQLRAISCTTAHHFTAMSPAIQCIPLFTAYSHLVFAEVCNFLQTSSLISGLAFAFSVKWSSEFTVLKGRNPWHRCFLEALCAKICLKFLALQDKFWSGMPTLAFIHPSTHLQSHF